MAVAGKWLKFWSNMCDKFVSLLLRIGSRWRGSKLERTVIKEGEKTLIQVMQTYVDIQFIHRRDVK